MIKHKWIGPAAATLMAASVLLLGIGYFKPSVFDAVTGSAEPAYASAMDKTKVLHIEIIADEKEWAQMLAKATAEEYIPATVIIDGVKTENAGIRPKGNSSLSMVARNDTTDRYSFKIEFDHYIPGQTWLGLDKIVVNNMQGDSTYMKEYLSYDLMDYIGVEAPLFAFSSISVNGEAWGCYLAVEALEDGYATRVYGNDHGKLYKPESMGMRGQGQMGEFMRQMPDGAFGGNLPPQPVVATEEEMSPPGPGEFPAPAPEPAEVSPPAQRPGPAAENVPNRERGGGGFGGPSGGATLQYVDDELASYSAIFENAVFKSTDSDYRRVIEALKKLNAGEDLDRVVDVAATLKYFAAQTIIVNLDSYISNMSHNYYLYEKNGQLTLLPWDFNLAFGGFQSGSASAVVNFPIDTPVSGVSLEDRPMLAKLLAVPEYLGLYHGYLRQITDGYFNSGRFSETIDLLDALITPYVEADPTAFYDFASYQKGVAELKKLGILRAQSIEGQLAGSIPATTAEQKVNPNALIDASDLNLSALGSMGGGGMPGGMPGREPRENGNNNNNNNLLPNGAGPGFDRANLEKAMEIIQAAGENELTEAQLAELQALGFTEEQIAWFSSRGPGGFAGGGGPPDNRPGAANRRPPRGNSNAGTSPPADAADSGAKTWIILGGSAICLFAGLLFVIFYKRRRPV